MKFILLISMISIISCCSNQKITSSKEVNDNIDFSDFIEKFNPLTLPLVVNKENYTQYDINIWNDNLSKYVQNPLVRIIDKSDYVFFNTRYPTDRNYLYYSFCKSTINTYIAAIMWQKNDSTQEYWLTLNIFDKKGDLIDTLIIAGQEVEQRDRFCVIDSNYNINIHEEKYLPPLKSNRFNYDILELKETYTIASNGSFQKIKSRQRRGYIDVTENDELKLVYYENCTQDTVGGIVRDNVVD